MVVNTAFWGERNPIRILDGEEGKDWLLGRADEHTWGGGDIVLWDQIAYSYNGFETE